MRFFQSPFRMYLNREFYSKVHLFSSEKYFECLLHLIDKFYSKFFKKIHKNYETYIDHIQPIISIKLMISDENLKLFFSYLVSTSFKCLAYLIFVFL
jgi:hypothetical protein